MATIDIKTTRRSGNPLTLRVPDGQASEWQHLEAADFSEITLISGNGEPDSTLRVAGVHRLYIDITTHQAYYNTGAGSWVAVGTATGGVENAVLYTAQELTSEQKAQARANIGAGTSDGSGGGDGRSDDDVRALVRTTNNIPGTNIQGNTITKSQLASGVTSDLQSDSDVNTLIDARVDNWARTNRPEQIPASHLTNDSIGEAKLTPAVTAKLHSGADITTQVRATTEIPGGHLVNDSVSEDKFENTIVTKLSNILTNDQVATIAQNQVDDVARARNTDRWPNEKVPLVTLDRLQTSILKQLTVRASAIVGDVGAGALVFLKGGESINGTPLVETMTYHPEPQSQDADNGYRVTPTDDQVPFGIALGPPSGNPGDAGLINVLVAGHYTKALLGVPSNPAQPVPQPTWTTNDKIYVGLTRSSFSQSSNRTAYFSPNRKDSGTDHENVLVGIVTGHEVEQGASEERLCYFDFTGLRAALDVKDQIPASGGDAPDAATEVPEAPTDGSGAVGTSEKYAREDHRHPAQDVDSRIATEAQAGNTSRWPVAKLSESVLVKEHQQLTANEKAQVRANIGAGTGGGSNVVLDTTQIHSGNVTIHTAYRFVEVTTTADWTSFEWLMIQWGGSHHGGGNTGQFHRWVKVSDLEATTATTDQNTLDFAGAADAAAVKAIMDKYYRLLGRFETTKADSTSQEDDVWGSYLAKKHNAQDQTDPRKIMLATVNVADPEPLIILGVGAIGISDDDIPLTGASAVKVKSEASIRRAIPSAATADPEPLGTAAPGDSTKYARENHVHALPDIPQASDAAPQSPGVASAGDSEDFARANHVHPQQVIPLVATALPVAPGTTAAVGTSAKYATEDHRHPEQDIYTTTKAIVTAGTNVTVTPNDTAKTLTLAATASGGGGVSDAVRYGAAQTLTATQQAQARANIGATETGPNGEIYGLVHNTETGQIDAGTLCVVGGDLPNEDTTGNSRVDTPTGVVPVVIGDVQSNQDSSAMRELAPPYGLAAENIAAGAQGKVLLKGLYTKALTGDTNDWAKDNNVYVRRDNDGLTPSVPLGRTHYIYDSGLSSRCYQVGVVVGPRAQQDVADPGGGNSAARVVAFDFTGREILTTLALEVAHSGNTAVPDSADLVPYLDTSTGNTLKSATVTQLNTGIANSLSGFVRFDTSQTLDDSERTQLRTNTGLAATSQIRTDTEIDGRIRPAARAGATTKWDSDEIADGAIDEKHLSTESSRLQFDTFKANEALSENQLVHLVGSDNDNNVCLIEWNQVPADGGPPVGLTTAAATQNAEVKILVAGHRRLALGGGVNDWAKDDSIYAYRHSQTQNYHFTNDPTDAGSSDAWRVGWVTGSQSAEAATVRDCYFDFRGLDTHSSGGSSSTLNIAGLNEENPLATLDTFVFADNTDSNNNKKTTLRKMLAAVTPDQATAEAGTDNQHAMTPLRTKQAIEAVGVGDLDQLRGDLLYTVTYDASNARTATVVPQPDNLPSNWRGTSGTARVSFPIGDSRGQGEKIMHLVTPGRVNNAQGFVLRTWEVKSGTREYDKEIFLAWGEKLTNSEHTILFSDHETDEIWHDYNTAVHPHEPRLHIKRSAEVTTGSELGFDLHWWLGGRGPKGLKGDEGDPGPAGGMPAVPANNGLYLAKRENGNQLGWDAIADHPFRISAVGPKIYHGFRAESAANIRWTPQSALPSGKGWKDLTGLTTNYFSTGDQFGSARWPLDDTGGRTPDAIAIGERPSGCMGLVIRVWQGPDTEWSYTSAGTNIVQQRVEHYPEIFIPWQANQRDTGASPHEYSPFTPFGSTNNGVTWTSFSNGRPALRFQLFDAGITLQGYSNWRVDIHLWQPTITVTT